MARKKNLKVNITADASGLDKETKRANSSIGNFTSKAKRDLAGLVTGFASVGMAIRALSSAFRTISDFQSANSKLAAVLGTTTKGVKDLTQAAIELGRKTQYTASEVTDLQTELAKLGFSESEIKAMQEPVLKFAAAVGTDLATAAARAGATMRGFGLTAEETGEMLATMAVSTSKSALSFNYLDESLGKLVPVTKSFGLDTKSTIALLGTLANAGIDSSSATTALRNTIIELANSESKLSKELGSQPRNMTELLDAMAKLRDRHLSVADASDLVGKRAAPAFLALLDGADACRDLYTELQNVNTALDDMYTTMTDNVEGSVNKLKSAWEGFTLSLRDSQGPIKWIIDRLTDLVQLMNLGITGFKSAKIDEKIEKRKREWQDLGMTPEEMQAEVDYRQNRIDRAKENGASKREIKDLVEEFMIAFTAMQDLTKPSTTTTTTGGGGGGGGGGSDKGKKGKLVTFDDANEIAAYDKQMSDLAAHMLENYEELHPVIDQVKESILEMAYEGILATEKLERAEQQRSEEFRRQHELNEEAIKKHIETVENFYEELDRLMQGFVVDTLSNVGTFIGEALTGGFDDAAANLGNNLLDSLGSLAQQVGELAIGVGTTELAIQKSLETLNPYVALAAGAALVALGAAVKSAASNIAAGMGSYSSSRSLDSYGTRGGSDDLEARTINIRVTGRLTGDGRNLIGVIQETEKVTNHTT